MGRLRAALSALGLLFALTGVACNPRDSVPRAEQGAPVEAEKREGGINAVPLEGLSDSGQAQPSPSPKQ
jgi:hypothetical protein